MDAKIVLIGIVIAYFAVLTGVVLAENKEAKANIVRVDEACPTIEDINHQLPLYVYVEGKLHPVRACLAGQPEL